MAAKKAPKIDPSQEQEPVHFPSDTHRRVLGHLPLPDQPPMLTTNLGLRMQTDPFTPFNEANVGLLSAVLNELSDKGWADQAVSSTPADISQEEWKMTKDGLAALRGPAPPEVPDG